MPIQEAKVEFSSLRFWVYACLSFLPLLSSVLPAQTNQFDILITGAKVVDGSGSHTYLMVLLGGDAGLRLGEIAALEWGTSIYMRGGSRSSGPTGAVT